MKRKKVVLIVDDDIIVCNGLRKLIPWQELGVEELLEEHNGQDAYETAVLRMPDLIISDIKMPVMDGLALCEKLHEIMVDVPIVLLSAYEDFEYARTAMQFDVKYYILKPMNRQRILELVEAISDILDKREKKRNCYSDIFDGSLQSEIEAVLIGHNEETFLHFFEDRVGRENLTNETKLVMCIGLMDVLYNYLENMEKGIGRRLMSREEALRELLRIRHNDEVLNFVRKIYIEVIQMSKKQLAEKDDFVIEEMKQYIEGNYADENLSVTSLSEVFHFTPSYFSDFFKRGTQMNPNAYITAIRIRKACELLEQPFSKVAVVAKQVGFRDSLYFSKVFKKYCGMTPSDYQNLNKM